MKLALQGIFLVVSISLTSCSSLPKKFADLGATIPSGCPKEITTEDSNMGILVLSVESDILLDTWYLEISDINTGALYIPKIKHKKIGMPTKASLEKFRYNAKQYCFMLPPGDYKVSKLHAFASAQKNSSFISDDNNYKFNKNFKISSNNVSYMGRLVLLDLRMKGKGYWGRMGTTFKEMFKSFATEELLPEDIEINLIDSQGEDLGWFLKKYSWGNKFENVALIESKQ